MDKSKLMSLVRQIASGYLPNQDVIKRISLLDLIAVVGPTGVGKSKIIDESGLHLVLSDMTRTPRAGEKDGIDVWFRSDYDKLLDEIKNGEFAQFLVGHTGEFYGTKYSSYPEQGLCVMPIITGALPAFYSLGFKSVKTVYILPPSFDEWMSRAKMHDDPDINKRFIEAEESLSYALNNEVNFIVNDDLGRAIQEFKSFANSGSVESSRKQEAIMIAQDLLARIRQKLGL